MENANHMVNSTNINLKETIFHYLKYWKLFLLSFIIVLFISYLYLRYTVPIYSSQATILVKDERKGGMASEFAAFSDLSMFGSKSNVDNEIEIIQSRTIIKKAIEQLSLNISYVNLGRIKDGEMYKEAPFTVLFKNQDEKFYDQFHSFNIKATSSINFEFEDPSNGSVKKYKFGQEIPFKSGFCLILKNDNFTKQINSTIKVEVLPIESVIESYKSRLKVETFNKYSSVVNLSIADPISKRASDFLDVLIENYNKDAIEDKNFIADNTSKFIEDRLRIITKELEGVEKDAEEFKIDNKVTDITSEAELFLENASEFQRREIETETQLKIVNTLVDYLNSNSSENLIPANILTNDVNAAGLIDQYNNLVLERNRLLKSAGPENALVKNVDKRINSLKFNVNASLMQLKTSLQIQKNDLRRQNNIVSGRISRVPTQEKEFRIIARQQQVKEALYLYLLEKREETAISLAVTEPNAKVIDAAHASSSPVSPKRKFIYLIALALGFFIPFSLLYIVSVLDTKIKSRNDILNNTTIPFIGDIPKGKSDEKLVVANSRSSIAEAIRILRTNLEFLIPNNDDGIAKKVFLTSTFPKEGKTFVSINLAATIAMSDKKVLLVGMDIRNPKFDEYCKVPSKGLTNYLIGNENLNIEDFIVKMDDVSSLDILPAGIVPPNPAELLMSSKIEKLFALLEKKYDYIIVDTAPVSLVTDTLTIAKYADAFVYVTKANFLDKRMLELPQKLYTEKKLPNMSILLNGVELNSSFGYGYGYGYGYGAEIKEKKWYQKFKKN